MVFPITPLEQQYEIFIDDEWVDLFADSKVYGGDRSTTTSDKGRGDWASQVDAGRFSFQLNNRDGDFSPNNPLSPYFGFLKLNTLFRHSVSQGVPYLWIIDETATAASTPDAAALDITGDIDIRVEFDCTNLRTSSFNLISKYATVSDERSYAFFVLEGIPYFRISTDGTESGIVERNAKDEDLEDVLVPITQTGKIALRVTMDVNNGAGGNDTAFYYSDSIAGTWTQLGETQTLPGTPSIFSSTADLVIGPEEIEDVSGEEINAPPHGRIHKVSVRTGIAGAEVANPDFTIQTVGDNSFADAAGRTWTIGAGGEISNRRWRFHGDIPELPTEWDVTGNDIWSDITASGILRRIRNDNEPLESPIFRWIIRNADGLIQYWPCEETESARSFGSAVGGPSLKISLHAPNLAANEEFIGSKPLPQLIGDSWRGGFPSYTHTGELQLRWLMSIDSAGSTNGQTIVEFQTSNHIYRVRYETGGTLRLQILTDDESSIQDNTGLFTDLDGIPLLMSLELTQDGADIDWALRIIDLTSASVSSETGTITNRTLRRAKQFIVSPLGGIDDISLGHIYLQNQIDALDAFENTYVELLNAWTGEAAARRVKRLCEEEGIEFVCIGDIDATEPMGPQPIESFATLLDECVSSEAGLLFEPANLFGIGIRTRGSLETQTPITLDYEANELAPGIRATFDTSLTRNDITVQNRDGTFARRTRTVTESPLNISQPPVGIGRIPHQVDVNVNDEARLLHLANWYLHLGTFNQVRIPNVSVAMHHSSIVSNSALGTRLLEARPGDLILIDNFPIHTGYDQVKLIIEGQSESISNMLHGISWNTTPGDLYNIAIFDDDDARFDTDGSELIDAIDDNDTTLNVQTTSPPRWTADVCVLDLDAAATDDFASTPDNAALDIAGDIDLRIKVRLNDLTPSALSALVGKHDPAASQGGYVFRLNTTGILDLRWSTAAAPSTNITRAATVELTAPVSTVRPVWLRATLDVNNGAAGHDVNFYYSFDGENWVKIGATVTTAGTTNINANTALLAVGARDGTSGADPLDGDVHAAEVRSGIGGTVVANPDFSRQAASATSFTDDAGRVWTVDTNAAIVEVEEGEFDFPINIGGEKMDVDLIRGSLEQKQIFTVTRSLNGIVKSHAAGSSVELFDPVYFS